MPTYTVVSPTGLLTSSQRAAIAAGITQVHSSVTGAPTYFAQVIFNDVLPGNWFVGGAPLDGNQVFVSAQIRAGRTDHDKQRLITQLVGSVAHAAGLPQHDVWVYLAELPAPQMAEFGHPLPVPGEEAAWEDALPEVDRERMRKVAGR